MTLLVLSLVLSHYASNIHVDTSIIKMTKHFTITKFENHVQPNGANNAMVSEDLYSKGSQLIMVIL